MKKTHGIEINPQVMFGKPVITGTRITVELILDKLTAGQTFEEILDDYPHITKKDIQNALDYASSLVKKKQVPPARQNVQATLHKISR